MNCRRVCFIAAGRRVGAVHVAPLMEASVWMEGVATVYTCMAEARPLGFAILCGEHGYWLAEAADYAAFQAAVVGVLGAARAS